MLFNNGGHQGQILAHLNNVPAKRNVAAAEISDINFASPAKKARCSETLSSDPKECQVSRPSKKSLSPPTKEELRQVHASLHSVPIQPALHLVMDEFAAEYVPQSESGKMPKSLSDLYNPDALKWGYLELLGQCAKIVESIEVTPDQSREVELATRKQSSCRAWFSQRTGRVTASIFKHAVRTNPDMPSPSLIKRICYPEAFRFSTPATRWGCDHEKQAQTESFAKLTLHHQQLTIEDCGFTINPKFPYIGPSPDGKLSCTCCGTVLMEIKCPYCVREGLPSDEDDNSMDRGFCIEKSHGLWKLKRDHAYFYQVQAQLNICEVDVCFFVLWTKSEIILQEVECEKSFFNQCMVSINHFYQTGVLPELVGKWLTRKPVQCEEGTMKVATLIEEASISEDKDPNTLWCFCEMPSFGDMVECKNPSCSIIKFHMDCLRIRGPPKGKWYCPHCRKLPKFSRKQPKKK